MVRHLSEKQQSKLSPEQFRKNLNKAIDDLVVHKNIIRDLFKYVLRSLSCLVDKQTLTLPLM